MMILYVHERSRTGVSAKEHYNLNLLGTFSFETNFGAWDVSAGAVLNTYGD